MTLPFAALFWATLVVYALAVGAQLAGHLFRAPRWTRLAAAGVVAGLAAHTALVAWRWAATGHVPTIGTFENALFGAWFIAAMAWWAGRRDRYPLVATAALPFALLILGGGALGDTSPSPLIASLHSFWLYIHIFFAWLAYGGYTVACGAAVVYLVKTRRGQAPVGDELAKLDELMFRTTAFGFVTDAVMIAAGAIWAKDLWGSYWSWDPVETWSLLSWIVYGLVLHLRTTLGWRGRPVAWILVFAIVTVLVTFWGVNLVMSGSAHVFNVD
jgi:cytochrome c-type biogenesis protein CcsB